MADESRVDGRLLTLMEQLTQQADERNKELGRISSRLEMFGAQLVRQGERLDRLESQYEKLYNIVAGSDERSLVLRLSRMEQHVEVLRQNQVNDTKQLSAGIDNNAADLEELLEWRNKAAGVTAAVLLLWIVATTVLNFVLR